MTRQGAGPLGGGARLVTLLVLLACAAPRRAAADPVGGDPAPPALASAPAWRKLLFYVPRLARPADSVVDDPGFFLAPDGGRDPGAELAATLRAFALPVAAGGADAHALCRFPARRAWLGAQLPAAAATWPQPQCPALARWRERLDVQRVSLVFASNYLNNPASLFGHTFLRLHRRPQTPGGPPPPTLLDHAVNFAATATTANPFAYSFLGVTGGFHGTFSLLPYYLKIQEYNNSESRDLWEYELSLSDAEVKALLDVLWEVGQHWISYYYIDGNCSFIMLLLLDAVRPELRLGEQFRLLVTPADTVRAVAAAPGLVGGVRFRPASLTRYEARVSALNDGERALVERTFAAEDAGEPLPSYAGLPPRRRAEALDAALDWIDYAETLAGDRQAVRYRRLQDWLLAQRAATGVGGEEAAQTPAESRPDLGPPSLLAAVGGGRDLRGRAYAEVEWRPTLHSLESPARGFSGSLEFAMADVVVRRRLAERGAELERLTLLAAESLPSVEPLLTPLAWRMAFGVAREEFGAERLRGYGEGGVGLAWAPRASVLRFYGLGLVQGGWSAAFRDRWLVEPAVLAGGLWALRPDLAASASWRVSRTLAGADGRTDRRWRVQTTWQARPTLEWKAYADGLGGDLGYGLMAGLYF